MYVTHYMELENVLSVIAMFFLKSETSTSVKFHVTNCGTSPRMSTRAKRTCEEIKFTT